MRVACAVVLGGAAGCIPEEPLGVVEDIIVVEGVLDLAASRHFITIRTFAGRGWDVAATVTVSAPDGTVFTGIPDSVPAGPTGTLVANHGRYRVATGDALRAGHEYVLRVTMADGRQVTGSTRMPTAAPALPPQFYEPFLRHRDTVRVTWPDAGAAAYWVHIYGHDAFENVVIDDEVYAFFAQSSVTLAGTARTPFDEPIFGSDRATITVSAVDANFYEYYRTRVDPFAPAPASRLSGGIGVFGAIVPIVVRRYVVFD